MFCHINLDCSGRCDKVPSIVLTVVVVSSSLFLYNQEICSGRRKENGKRKNSFCSHLLMHVNGSYCFYDLGARVLFKTARGYWCASSVCLCHEKWTTSILHYFCKKKYLYKVELVSYSCNWFYDNWPSMAKRPQINSLANVPKAQLFGPKLFTEILISSHLQTYRNVLMNTKRLFDLAWNE